MNKSSYLGNKNVLGFIEYLFDAINGKLNLNHNIHIRDPKTPDTYERDLRIGNLKDAFDSYFWDKKNFDQTSLALSEMQFKLCDAYFSNNSKALLLAVSDVFDWGLMPEAAKHNKTWATKHNLMASMRRAMKILVSDKPNTKFFNNTDCRMNAGFTKVYALLHPGILIYDGRVGAALGYLARKFLEAKRVTTVPKELQFPWAIGAGKTNRNPSCGQFHFPSLQAVKQCGHAEWSIKANWILQAVVKQCIEKNVAWPSGNAMRQLEAALFMIGYELPTGGTSAGSGSITNDKTTLNAPYVPAKLAKIRALACQFDVNELIDYMRVKGVTYLIQGQQQVSYADHSKKSSLDYWIRGKASNRDQKQADNGVMEQLIQTGYFFEDRSLECPDTKQLCKGIVLNTQ